MRQHQGAYLVLMHSCTAWGSRDECLFQGKHWCNLHNSHESARGSCSQSPHVNRAGERKGRVKEPAPCTGKSTKGDGSKEPELRRRGVVRKASMGRGGKGAEN